ncbi:hypothetical protein BC828DRAFT_383697 [Blastocladiella britannica]|nr:hypothetical protein BC828DRAFT_383697 [Blastocladiella britannica]
MDSLLSDLARTGRKWHRNIRYGAKIVDAFLMTMNNNTQKVNVTTIERLQALTVAMEGESALSVLLRADVYNAEFYAIGRQIPAVLELLPGAIVAEISNIADMNDEDLDNCLYIPRNQVANAARDVGQVVATLDLAPHGLHQALIRVHRFLGSESRVGSLVSSSSSDSGIELADAETTRIPAPAKSPAPVSVPVSAPSFALAPAPTLVVPAPVAPAVATNPALSVSASTATPVTNINAVAVAAPALVPDTASASPKDPFDVLGHNLVSAGDVKLWDMRHQIANSTITNVCIENNPIGAQGILILNLAMTQPCQNLVHLALKHAELGDRDAKAIAVCLPKSLITLDLHYNQIGDAGATAIAANMPESLSVLYLSSNRICNDGAKAIAAAIPPTLTELYLTNNKIGDYGANMIASNLPSSLTILSLFLNQIGDSGQGALKRAWAPRPHGLTL